MPKKTKICLYCPNETGDDPHFESGCCGRGMCDECYDGLIGTTEQMQVAQFDFEDDDDFLIKKEYEDEEYLCFECAGIWRKELDDNNLSHTNWTTKKLKDEYTGYYALVNTVGCHGASDIRMLDALKTELFNRGVEINAIPTFS